MATITGYHTDRMTMQRNVLKLTAMCAAMVLPGMLSAQGASPCAKTGFAFVSSGDILASIPAYLQADSLVQKDVAAYKLELAKLTGAFDSASQAYSQSSTMLSGPAKAAKVKQLETQQDFIRQRAAELDQKVTLRNQELKQPIQVRVQGILDGMRNELNCAVIFDAGGGQGGLGIASADKSLDLTTRVIERIRAADPAKPASKPPAGGVKPPSGGPELPMPAQP